MRTIGRKPFLSEVYTGDEDELETKAKEELKAPLKLNRRDFLKTMSAASVVTAAGVASMSAKGTLLGAPQPKATAKTLQVAPPTPWQKLGAYPYTACSLILDMLVKHECKYIFGVAGSAEREMYDNFARDEYKDKLTWIQTGYEYNAMMMAVGYAKAREKAAAALFHVSVGAPAAALGFLNAVEGNVPILAWTAGTTGTTLENDWTDRGYGHSKSAEFMEPYCKWSYKIIDNTHLDDIINRAFRVSETAPQGPVFLNHPQALNEEVWTGPKEITQLAPPEEANIVAANPDDVQLIADKLSWAKNPWIVTSRVGRYKSNVAKLTLLAEILGAGVVESSRVYVNFPTDHACHQGYSTSPIKDADVILVLDHYGTTVPEDAWVAHVFDNPQYLMGLSDLPVFADSRAFLTQLLSRVRLAPDRSVRLAKLKASHDKMVAGWKAEAEKRWNEYPPSHARLWSEINNATGPDDIVVLAKGFAQSGACNQYLERLVPGGFYTNDTAAMGIAGMAIGIQLAEPNKRVICAMGDWEAHESTVQELLYTSAHHNIPVIWIVMDNQSGFTVRRSHWMLEKAIYDYSFTPNPRFWTVELDQPRLDWARLAEACGVPGTYCDTADEFGLALEKAKARNGPSLLSFNCQCNSTYVEGLSPLRDKQ